MDIQGELGAAGTHYNLPLIFTNHAATTVLSVPWTVGTPVDNADRAAGAVAAHVGPVTLPDHP